MAKGRPRKWATAYVYEPIPLGKAGLKITIWDKYGRTKRGEIVVSVGGIRWTPYGKHKPHGRKGWDKLINFLLG